MKWVLGMPVAEMDELRRFERGAIMVDGGSVSCRAVVMLVCVVRDRVVLVACQFVAVDMEVIATRVLVEDQSLARYGDAGREEQHRHRCETADANPPALH